MAKHMLDGIVVAPVTAFHDNAKRTINVSVIGSHMKALHAAGVIGAWVNGTTSECMSMTIAERMKTAETWVAEARKLNAKLVATKRRPKEATQEGRKRIAVEGESGVPMSFSASSEEEPSSSVTPFRIIVHVGHACVESARQLAKHAVFIGADGVAAVPPFYHRPGTVEELVDVMSVIASAAPELPFYYYHFPGITHVDLPLIPFFEASVGKIPNMAGIKMSTPNVGQMGECARWKNGRLNVLCGADECYDAALMVGVSGAVGSTYNFPAVATVYARMHATFRSWETPFESALPAQEKSKEPFKVVIPSALPLIRQLMVSGAQFVDLIYNKSGGHPALRAALKVKASWGKMIFLQLAGLDVGPPRLPFRPLPLSKLSKLHTDLIERGFLPPSHGWEDKVKEKGSSGK